MGSQTHHHKVTIVWFPCTYYTCVRQLHAFMCRAEREKYAKHRRKAEKYPQSYLSIIIDGMDQDKTDIPHIISNPKAMAGQFSVHHSLI